MKILALCASLREKSLNGVLLGHAATALVTAGAEVDVTTLREFPMPLYDGDWEDAHGPPAAALALAERIQRADGLVIASPEYNFSLSGALKNAIDWLSRLEPLPLTGKPGLLVSASTAGAGGARGLWQLRIPLEACGVHVHPEMFALPAAGQAFDETGLWREARHAQRLAGIVQGYLRVGRAIAGAR
jgi:NAD(P)H-dependent FMN reductase